MCLIAIATQTHPRYPLIIAANRDEFYHRPTSPLAFWQDHPEVLAGRDLEQNGTWLGMTKTGRLAAITNYREPASINPGAPSRGHLVSNFLISEESPEDYLTAIRDSGKNFNGFNLVVGDLTHLWWYSNRNNRISEITPGFHAISNHLLDTPWPKIRKTLSGLRNICRLKREILPEDIFGMLADTSRPPDNELPETGVGLEWERILSSIFVSSEIYGTRSSAVILGNSSGRITFAERTFNPRADFPVIEDTRTFEIKLPDVFT